MRRYEKPKFSIMLLSAEDVITASVLEIDGDRVANFSIAWIVD
jgi:hypothetical protein